MIVYLIARTVAWLYGYGWPLGHMTRSNIAIMSFVEMLLVVAFAIAWCFCETPRIISESRKRKDSKNGK